MMNCASKVLAAFVVASMLVACGSSTDVIVKGSTKITKGQELTDLQRALNEGAISQREYEELRTVIMRRN